MIQYVKSDLFQSPAQTLVNTVNTVGVMGKGIARQFKEIYPEMFSEYRSLCEGDKFKIGSLHLYRSLHKYVLNFPTKIHWRNPSKPEYIEAGLKAFVNMYERAGISSIAFPPLGCGNGGLDFDRQVRPLMEKYLKDLPISVFIHLQDKTTGLPEHRIPEETKKWLRSSPQDLSFPEVWEDLIEIVGSKRVFSTFRNTPYEATVVHRPSPDEDGIRIVVLSRTWVIELEQIRMAWQQLRSFGFISAPEDPKGPNRDLYYLMPILTELDYLKAVVLGDDYNGIQRQPRSGLKYVKPLTKPTATDVKPALFDVILQ